MPDFVERLYRIDGISYWESNFPRSVDKTLYKFNGNFYTREELEQMSSSWEIYYDIGYNSYMKETLDNIIKNLQLPNSTTSIGGLTRTREQLERLLKLGEPPASTTNPPKTTNQPKDGMKTPKITQITLFDENTETPPASEDKDKDENKDTDKGRDEDEDVDEEDELVAKVIANLRLKMQAVKRHKKVEAEVKELRKLLVEKEADLAECQRIMASEVEQVKTS